MFRANVRIVTAVVSVLVAGASSQAGVVVPEGLKPGDTYHLAFVTAGIRDATSSNIADYNQFVNDQAALNPALTGTDIGVQWFAIASTATVNARDNALVGFFSPVYLLNGTTRIADGFSDLWDGALNSPLTLDQFLFTSTFHPWTGSNVGGIASNPLGSASGITRVGNSNQVNFSAWWIAFDNENNSNLSDLYALSEELTVPPPCPEDINGDCVINVLDLIDLLLCFGLPAVPGCEAEDTNGDGTVNVLDLIELLLAFGTACPG